MTRTSSNKKFSLYAIDTIGIQGIVVSPDGKYYRVCIDNGWEPIEFPGGEVEVEQWNRMSAPGAVLLNQKTQASSMEEITRKIQEMCARENPEYREILQRRLK